MVMASGYAELLLRCYLTQDAWKRQEEENIFCLGGGKEAKMRGLRRKEEGGRKKASKPF